MTYLGHVRNGNVVLEPGVALPEGAAVEVRLLAPTEEAHVPAEIPTLFERLQPVVGAASGLPADLAENHDHYLHGQPKQTAP